MQHEKNAMRELVAQTVEVDVVLRDPQSTLRQAIVGVLVVFAVGVVRIWIGPIGLSRGNVRVVGLIAIVGVGVTLFRLPVWVRVGPGGVAFRAWFRTGRFPWSDIESFDVGNPSEPRFAYMMVRLRGERVARAVKAPSFSTISASELVRELKAKQRVFAREGA